MQNDRKSNVKFVQQYTANRLQS